MAIVGAVEAYGFLAPTPPVGGGKASFSFVKQAGLCSGRTFAFTPTVFAEGQIPIPVVNATEDVGWRGSDVNVELELEGQACDAFGNFVAARFTNISLWATDLTQPLSSREPWVLVSHISVSPQAMVYPSPPIEVYHTDESYFVRESGQAYLASITVDWLPFSLVHVTVTFHVAVNLLLAQSHMGDRLRFELSFAFDVGETACLGACWTPIFADEPTGGATDFESTIVTSQGSGASPSSLQTVK